MILKHKLLKTKRGVMIVRKPIFTYQKVIKS